ncbi:conserved Plasmodium protein, unknown function [Plasmodium ovale wallikeri]|uniref:Uncharacterized protein n=1 Tax=Plasmodium ovale wallikeri TaxID=864142 RepID=A0A1A8YKG1_PLAOA|nr:conserved Plasmodium protein, unknown function [Plasmodium ovale wallikeri]
MDYRFVLKKQELCIDIDMQNGRIEGNTFMNIALYMPIYYLYDEEDFHKNNFDLSRVIIRKDVNRKGEDKEGESGGKTVKSEKGIKQENTFGEYVKEIPLQDDKSYIKFVKRKKEKKLFVILQIPHNMHSSSYHDVKLNGKEEKRYYIIYNRSENKNIHLQGKNCNSVTRFLGKEDLNHDHNIFQKEVNYNTHLDDESANSGEEANAKRDTCFISNERKGYTVKENREKKQKHKKKKKKKINKIKKKEIPNHVNVISGNVNNGGSYESPRRERTVEKEEDYIKYSIPLKVGGEVQFFQNSTHDVESHYYERGLDQCDRLEDVDVADSRRRVEKREDVALVEHMQSNQMKESFCEKKMKGKKRRKKEEEKENRTKFDIVDFVSLSKYIDENYLKENNYMFVAIDEEVLKKEKEKNYTNLQHFCKNEKVIIDKKEEYNVKLNITVSLSFTFFNLNAYYNNIYFKRQENILITLENYSKDNTWFPTLSKCDSIYSRCHWVLMYKIEKPYFVISSNSLICINEEYNKNYFLYKTTNKDSRLFPDQVGLYAGDFNFLHLNNLKLRDSQPIDYDFLYKSECFSRNSKIYSIERFGKMKNKHGSSRNIHSLMRFDRGSCSQLSKKITSSPLKRKYNISRSKYYEDSDTDASDMSDTVGVICDGNGNTHVCGEYNPECNGMNKRRRINEPLPPLSDDQLKINEHYEQIYSRSHDYNESGKNLTENFNEERSYNNFSSSLKYFSNSKIKEECCSYFEKVNNKIVPNIFIFSVKDYKSELMYSTFHIGYILKCFLDVSKENFPYDNLIILFLPIHFSYLDVYYNSESIECCISSHTYDDIKNGYNLFSNGNILNYKITEPYVYFKNNKYFIFGNVIVFSTLILHNIYDILFNINLYTYKFVMAEGILSLCFHYYDNVVKNENPYFIYMLKCFILQRFIENIFGTIEMNAIFYELRERYCSLVELFGDITLFQGFDKDESSHTSHSPMHLDKHSSHYIFNNIYFLKCFLCVRVFFNLLKNFSFCNSIHQYCFSLFFSYFKRKGKVIHSSKFWKKVFHECTRRYIESYKQLPKNKFKMKRVDVHLNSSELKGEEHEQYQLFEKYFSFFFKTYIKGYGVGQHVLTFNVHLQRKGTSMDSFNFLASQNSINPFCFVDKNYRSNYFLADVSSMIIFNLLELNKYIDVKNSLEGSNRYHDGDCNRAYWEERTVWRKKTGKMSIAAKKKKKSKIGIPAKMKKIRKMNTIAKMKKTGKMSIVTKIARLQTHFDKIYFEKLIEKKYMYDLHNNIENKFLTFLKKKGFHIDHFYEYPREYFSQKGNKLLNNFIIKKKKKNYFLAWRQVKKQAHLGYSGGFALSTKGETAKAWQGKTEEPQEPQEPQETRGEEPVEENEGKDDCGGVANAVGDDHEEVTHEEDSHILNGKQSEEGRAPSEIPPLGELNQVNGVKKEEKKIKTKLVCKRGKLKRRKIKKGKTGNRKKKNMAKARERTRTRASKPETVKRRRRKLRRRMKRCWEVNPRKTKKDRINNHDKVRRNYVLRKKKELINLPYSNFDSLDLIGRDGNFYLGFGYVGSDDLTLSTGKGNLYNNIIAFQKYKNCNLQTLSEVCIDKHNIYEYNASPFHTSCVYPHWKTTFRMYFYLLLLNKIYKKKTLINSFNMAARKRKEINIFDCDGSDDFNGSGDLCGGRKVSNKCNDGDHNGKHDKEQCDSSRDNTIDADDPEEEEPSAELGRQETNEGANEGANEEAREEVNEEANGMVENGLCEDTGRRQLQGEHRIERKRAKRERKKKRRREEKIKRLKQKLGKDKKYVENYLNSYVSNNIPLSVDEHKFFFSFLKIEIIEDDGIRVVKKYLINNTTPFRFSVNARPEKGRKKVAFKHETLLLSKNGNYINKNNVNNEDNYVNKTVKFVGLTNDSDRYMIEYCKQKILKKDKSLLCLDNRKLVAKICSKNKIPVLWMRVDSDFFILGRIRRTQSISMWIQQLNNDNNIFSQLESSFALAFIPFFYLNKNITSNFTDYKQNFTAPNDNCNENSTTNANNDGIENTHNDNVRETTEESSIPFLKSVLSQNKNKQKQNFHFGNINGNISPDGSSNSSTHSQLGNDLLNNTSHLDKEKTKEKKLDILHDNSTNNRMHETAGGPSNGVHGSANGGVNGNANSGVNGSTNGGINSNANGGANASSNNMLNTIVSSHYMDETNLETANGGKGNNAHPNGGVNGGGIGGGNGAGGGRDSTEADRKDGNININGGNADRNNGNANRNNDNIDRNNDNADHNNDNVDRNSGVTDKKLVSAVNPDAQNDFLKMGVAMSSQSSSQGSASDNCDFNFTSSTIDDLHEENNSSERNYSSTSLKKKKVYKKRWKNNISISNIPINVEVIKCLYKSVTSDYLHYVVKIRCIYSLCFIHNKYICTQKIVQNLFLDYLNNYHENNLSQKKIMHAFYIALSLLRNRNNRTPKIVLYTLAQKCSSFVFSLKLNDRYNIRNDLEGGHTECSLENYTKQFCADRKGDITMGRHTNKENCSKIKCTTSNQSVTPVLSLPHLGRSFENLKSANKDVNVKGSVKWELHRREDHGRDVTLIEKITRLTNRNLGCKCNVWGCSECVVNENHLNSSEKKTSKNDHVMEKKILYDREIIIQKEEEEDIKMVLECIGNVKFKNEFLFTNLSNMNIISNECEAKTKEYLFDSYLSTITEGNTIAYGNNLYSYYLNRRRKKKKNYHAYDFYDINIYGADKKIDNHFSKLKKTKKEYVEELVNLLFLIHQLKKLSPYLPISDSIISILIRTICRNKNVLDAFKKKVYIENKDHFDVCEYLPNGPFQSKMISLISPKNLSFFTTEVLRALLHLILGGVIRVYLVGYQYAGDFTDKSDTQIRPSETCNVDKNDPLTCPSFGGKKEKSTYINHPSANHSKEETANLYEVKEEKYENPPNNSRCKEWPCSSEPNGGSFFASTYTNYVERKVICSHLLNIHTAIQFCYQVIQIYNDCELEMLLWSNLHQLLLIFQQKYPFFFLPFSKYYNKYFKDFQKRKFTVFNFYYFLYGVDTVNEYEKRFLSLQSGLCSNALGGGRNQFGCDHAFGRKLRNWKERTYDYTLSKVPDRGSYANMASSQWKKSPQICSYSIVGYIPLINILRSVTSTNKFKKNFIQITYEWPRIYKPHYTKLNNSTSKGVPINDLIRFLRTYYDNDKLLKWKTVASEFVNVLKNMKELQLFVDSPTTSLYNFDFAKENTWLSLISEKIKNDIYKLPMDLKKDILLLLKNIRLVDMSLGTNHYEYVNNIFTVCWFIIVKIFQNYEKSKKSA